MVYVSFGIKRYPISKISNKNGLVDWFKWSSSCLANAKFKAVSSHCSTTNKKKTKKCHRPHTFHDFIDQLGASEDMWLQSAHSGELIL
jgi:hypothetical protein